jgi:uncharacterized membrane protein YkvA (DUF1232 family)
MGGKAPAATAGLRDNRRIRHFHHCQRRFLMASQKYRFPPTYTDRRFQDKLLTYAKAAGRQVIEKALWLYYAAQNPATPKWARTVIYGALGYFIFPIDAIPDMIPVVGYADDLGVLLAAIATVSFYITDDIKTRAAQKLQHWFGA